jgi:hypothetical protein
MTPWNKFNSTTSNRQLKSFVTILHSNVCSVDAKHRQITGCDRCKNLVDKDPTVVGNELQISEHH